MNTTTIDGDGVIVVPEPSRARKSVPAVVPPGEVTPMSLLAVAVQRGASLEEMKQLLDLKREWEADEARKVFNEAMAAFKANPPTLKKNKEVDFTNREGKRTNYMHATLDEVSIGIGKALAPHGLKHAWNVVQKDGGMIEVTCTLSHRQGHSESVSMSAGRDDSGNKNNIQGLGSTVTYLERYTLLAVTGMAVQDQDDDGRGAGGERTTDDKRPEQKKDAGPKVYPTELFDANFATWEALIKKGKKTAGQIITTVTSKGTLTAEQKKKITDVKKDEGGPIVVTFAQVEERLRKAEGRELRDVAADFINAIPDEAQRAELTKLYHELNAKDTRP